MMKKNDASAKYFVKPCVKLVNLVAIKKMLYRPIFLSVDRAYIRYGEGSKTGLSGADVPRIIEVDRRKTMLSLFSLPRDIFLLDPFNRFNRGSGLRGTQFCSGNGGDQ